MQFQKIVYKKHLLFLILALAAINVAIAQKTKSKVNLAKGWSLFGALTMNKQSVNDAGIQAPINYLYNSVNNNVFKPGYSGGFRYDGISTRNNNYSLSFAVNRVSAGTSYTNKYSLSPFMEDFTHFKADNQFTTLSVAAHYKMLLPISDRNKYKFYAVVGPSLDYKISRIDAEHLINGSGNRAFVNGDLGAEFDNKGYYVLYAHYKLGGNLAKSSAPIQMNRFELGMSIKVKDLF